MVREQTRRGLIAGLGGLVLAGIAEFVSDPAGEFTVSLGTGPDEESAPTTEGPSTVTVGPEGDVTPTRTGASQCLGGFKSGFEQPLEEQFQVGGHSVERSTEYARSGDHGVLMRARSSDFESVLLSKAVFCGRVTAEVDARKITDDVRRSVFSLGLVDPGSSAKVTVSPTAVEDKFQVQEWDTDGGVTGWSTVSRSPETDWASFRLSTAETAATGSVDGEPWQYQTSLDWTNRPVRVQLRTLTSLSGPDVAAAFDDLSVSTQ